MNDKYILDGNGNPVVEPDLIKWASWFETADRVVKQTAFDNVRVSTVFLGLNHAFADGPPVLRETMVFGGPLDGEMERYENRSEAILGHDLICDRVSKRKS